MKGLIQKDFRKQFSKSFSRTTALKHKPQWSNHGFKVKR